MKKILCITLAVMGISATQVYADDDIWVTAGYGYYISEEGYSSPLGPVNLTIGGQVTDWVAVDFTVGYMWGAKPSSKVLSPETDIDSLPVRFHLLVQPSFETPYFNVLPYIGIGPLVASNGLDFSNTNFSYGFSAKGGVRFINNEFLFGVGAEYIYNHLEVDYNSNKYKYNLSGVSVGAEIGVVF